MSHNQSYWKDVVSQAISVGSYRGQLALGRDASILNGTIPGNGRTLSIPAPLGTKCQWSPLLLLTVKMFTHIPTGRGGHTNHY